MPAAGCIDEDSGYDKGGLYLSLSSVAVITGGKAFAFDVGLEPGR
jgi:hypothetical protein